MTPIASRRFPGGNCLCSLPAAWEAAPFPCTNCRVLLSCLLLDWLKMYSSKLLNVFVQMPKCICPIVQSAFLQIAKCSCKIGTFYLVKVPYHVHSLAGLLLDRISLSKLLRCSQYEIRLIFSRNNQNVKIVWHLGKSRL